MRKTLKNLDIWGTTTSLLCAVHCAALPLLLSSGLISSSTMLNHPAFELCVLAATSVFVFFSIAKPYFTSRDNQIPFFMAIAGLFMVLIHHTMANHGTLVVVIGGILIASAHLINLFMGTHSHKKAI